MWPDCSPPIERPRLIISSITYLSPTGQRTSSMPRSRSAISRPMLLITVATIALPFSRPCAFMWRRAHQHHRVAVDDAPGAIDEDRAIAVAVERHAHAVAAARARARARLLRMRRAAIQVDVAAVGLVADARRRRSRARWNSRGATVVVAPFARVDRDLERGRAAPGRAAPAARARCRRRSTSVRSTGGSAAAGDLPARSAMIASTCALERLGELLAAAREHLDAVVLERIVRRGDHEPGVEAHRARDVGDRRRRDDAGAGDRRPFRVHAAAELALDPVAGFARVAADEEAQRPRLRSAARIARTSAAPSRATVS